MSRSKGAFEVWLLIRATDMPASPQRQRFQFHLSTALILTFAAGGLMWAQLPLFHSELCGEYFTTDTAERHFSRITASDFMKLPNRDVLVDYSDYRYGWPIPVSRTHVPVNMDRNGVMTPISPRSVSPRAGADVIGSVVVGVMDFLFALLVLWMLFRLCEWRIRRRASQNTA